MKRTRYFIDSEFDEDGERIILLSIGIACEDGRVFYAESSEADWDRPNDWVKANVLPHMNGPDIPETWLTRKEIADAIVVFAQGGDDAPEFWAWYGDYDWVVLCQLYGRMIDLPKHWPMFAMDVKQLAVSLGDPALPKQDGMEHHALADARWTKDAHEFLIATQESSLDWTRSMRRTRSDGACSLCRKAYQVGEMVVPRPNKDGLYAHLDCGR